RSGWRPRPLDDAAGTLDHPDPAGRLAHDNDIGRAVAQALDALTERQRTAIVLVHYQGFTNYEAAEMLDTSVDAVESLLARARRIMRSTLAPVAPDLLGE